ncbi:MAG: hypothetical protein ABI555_05055 [Chloroflexota bacterium]
MKRPFRIPARAAASVLLACILAACGGTPLVQDGRGSPVPTSSTPASTSPVASQAPTATAVDDTARAAGWNADLDLVVPGLERLHPNPFHSSPRTEVVAAVAALRARIATASDDELMTGVVRIFAMISSEGRDAHTGLYPWGGSVYPTHTLPLRLWTFPTGVTIVDALPPYEPLIGRTISTIDGQSIESIASALDPFIPRDNRETVTLLLPRFLLTMEILHGAGLVADTSGVQLEFADAPGVPVEVKAIPTSAYNDWATPYGLFLPIRQGVRYLARSEEPLWFDRDGSTLVIGYNRVNRLSTADLAPLKEALADPSVRRLIVDVRHNFGGETSGYPPLADALIGRAASLPDGLFVITARNTFSAGSLFTAYMTSKANVTIVGEPMGGSPSLFGNARDLALPFSGLTASVATEFFEIVPGDKRVEIAPDIPVTLTAADYFADRDAALQKIEEAGG